MLYCHEQNTKGGRESLAPPTPEFSPRAALLGRAALRLLRLSFLAILFLHSPAEKMIRGQVMWSAVMQMKEEFQATYLPEASQAPLWKRGLTF